MPNKADRPIHVGRGLVAEVGVLKAWLVAILATASIVLSIAATVAIFVLHNTALGLLLAIDVPILAWIMVKLLSGVTNPTVAIVDYKSIRFYRTATRAIVIPRDDVDEVRIGVFNPKAGPRVRVKRRSGASHAEDAQYVGMAPMRLYRALKRRGYPVTLVAEPF